MTLLQGKVALISGGASGLGAAFVEACAEQGAQVVFGDLLDDAGEKLEQALRALGGDVTYVPLDVTKEADWRNAVQRTIDRYGKLNILINNAGLVLPKVPIEEINAQDWDRTFAVNGKGVFLGTKYAIPEMRRCGGGSIINISSLAALGQARLQEPAYAASKSAVRIFTKVTAGQYAGDSIRCNSVHPGPINAGMLPRYLIDPEALKQRMSRIPLGRLGTAEEVVAGVLYLASDQSGFTTGTELVMDGGALVD